MSSMSSTLSFDGTDLTIHHEINQRAYVFVRFDGDCVKRVSYRDPDALVPVSGDWHSCNGQAGTIFLPKNTDGGLSFKLSAIKPREIQIRPRFQNHGCPESGTLIPFPEFSQAVLAHVTNALGQQYEIIQCRFSLVSTPHVSGEDQAIITIVMHDDDFGGGL